MTKNTKIILGVVVGLLVLCLIACGVGVLGFGLFSRNVAQTVSQNVKNDPAAAEQTAQKIATIDIPAGFQAGTSMNILGISMVVYENSANNNQSIFLLQMPTGGEINDTTIQQMQQAMERQTNRSVTNMKTVDSRTVTIRDKPAQIIIQEGVNNENQPYRSEMVAFQGNGGLAMLVISGPTASWDQTAYDKMVNTIR